MQQDKKLTIIEAGGIPAAVLVAVAIPVFTSQLEKSRDATSVANLRSAYAEAQAAYLIEDDTPARVTFTKGTNGAITAVAISNVALKGQQSGWSDLADDLPEGVDWSAVITDANGARSEDVTLTLTYATDGSITAAIS